MSAALLLLLCLLIESAILKDMKDLNVQELIELAEDAAQVRPNDVEPGDVSFYLFTRNQSNQQIFQNKPVMDTGKVTKIIIHGWLENHNRTWYDHLTKEYLAHDDFNVIQVDWERVARSFYYSSAQNTRLVGQMVGLLIIGQNLPPQKVHLIGHSLGAQVAAFAGKTVKKETGKRVSRITGLDPAGPYFRNFYITKNDRLNEDDAEIVDVIHTDGGFYGYELPCGTLDIYVNGGTRVQPGCLEDFKIVPLGELIADTFCSHSRSFVYFTEIINQKKFTCTKCESWEKFKEGLCNSNEQYVFGAEDVDVKMKGICFVQTGDSTIRNLLSGLLPFQAKDTSII